MRILFASSSSIALPLLRALSDNGLVGAVLTSPDKKGKHGSALIPTPIKEEAEKRLIPVIVPEHLGREARGNARAFSCDLLLSFSYGRIFGPKFLSLFKRTMNVHPSLLPRYRGPSPIPSVILSGDSTTGITLQEISLGIDEGRVLSSLSFNLDGRETRESLEERVSLMAPVFVLDTLMRLERIEAKPQEGTPSYTSLIGKDDGHLDFTLDAATLHRKIRALYPWPKAWGMLGGEKTFITQVYGSSFEPFESTSAPPGTILSFVKGKGLQVATASGVLYLTRLQAECRKESDARSFLNGKPRILGSIIS